MNNMNGRLNQHAAQARVDLVQAAVAQAFNIALIEMRAPTRRKAPIAFARQTAMYLSHVALGVSLTRTGACFGRDRTTASHACRVIEEKRDDPNFDMQLCRLEEGLAQIATRLKPIGLPYENHDMRSR